MIDKILSDYNVMVDLETMGNGPHAPIVSIGAYKFGAPGGKDHKDLEFYTTVNLASSMYYGCKPDADTIMWWLKQSDEARKCLTETKGKPLKKALEEFSIWIGKGAKVWGNGATFDNVVLASAYRLVGLYKPWGYMNDRCYRTIKNLYPEVKLEVQGVKHNALADAKSQADHLIQIVEANQNV